MNNDFSNIDRRINSVGTETFIKYFYDFQKLERAELLKTFKGENWSENSKSQKISNGFRIFKENREIEALEHILLKKKEGNIQNGTWVKTKAKEIYQQINNVDTTLQTNETVSEIEKKVLVNYRIQQSKFRRELILHWEGCSITNCKNSKLLIASHIKPYSESNDEEKYDINNGLLLTPTFDKLFDLNLISFTNEGKILLSNNLDTEDLQSLGITGNEKLKMGKVSEPILKYLEYQREKFEEIERNYR